MIKEIYHLIHNWVLGIIQMPIWVLSKLRTYI